ncbi:zinc finger, CCHC-type containing protein [Tanacetum coccineum]
MSEKYISIAKRHDEEYHTIKDDTLLCNMYTTKEVTLRAMQILDELLTDEIKQTHAYKDYVTVYGRVKVPTIQPKPVESTKGTITTPNPELAKKKKKGKQIAVHDDAKTNEDKDDDDHINHALNKTRRMGSSEVRTKKMQTPIPSPPSSIRTRLSLDKTIAKELTNEQTTRYHDATNEEDISANNYFKNIIENVDESLKEILPKLATSATNELVQQNLLSLIDSCRLDAFLKRDHDDHLDDDALPRGEKSPKRQKTSRGSKSTRGSSSKHPAKDSNTSAFEQPQQQDYDAWVEILTRILELKQRYFEDYYSDNQYAVSIKEDTAYPCLHSPKTTKETSSICRIQKRPIRRIEDIVCEDSGRYQTWRHFKTLSLDELRSPDFNLLSDQEYSEEEVAETMAETMEQYMSKTRADYGSGVARPKIEDKDNFELKGQFLKELRTNTFSRAFPMSLTGAASRWLRNEPTGSITTWDGLKTKFLNKYCPPARTAKKMEEINNFQQEPDENLYQAWE